MISSCMYTLSKYVLSQHKTTTDISTFLLLHFARFQCTVTALTTARAATREDRSARVASRATARASASGELYLSPVATYFLRSFILFETHVIAHHKICCIPFILFSNCHLEIAIQCHGQVQRTKQLEEVLPQEVLSTFPCTFAATPFIHHTQSTPSSAPGLGATHYMFNSPSSDLS